MEQNKNISSGAQKTQALALSGGDALDELRSSGGGQSQDGGKRRAPGFGGWLAAVIILGAVCLALAAVTAYGWINMSAMYEADAGEQRQCVYELNAIVDNLDGNLAKARVASSASDRAKVFSDIAVQSQMAELVVERLPVEGSVTGNMSAFLNKMYDSAQSMLHTVAAGGELSEWQLRSIEYMYNNNRRLKEALNRISAGAASEDILKAFEDGGELALGFGDIQNNVIEEPKGIFDGPFADDMQDTNLSYFDGMEEIPASEAEEIAADIFADYRVQSIKCTGTASRHGQEFYNVEIFTDDGEMLAQFSKKGGKLIMFDSFKPCTQHNFTLFNCRMIAERFLQKAGYENLKAVWHSVNGSTCSINFCPVQNGAIIYPDMIKVKVCEERGIVTGVEAVSYVLNHSQRDIPAPTITVEQAQSVIDGRINVKHARLALIPLDGEEVLCHEFFGLFGGSQYYVYVNAVTGEEVQVLTVISTATGRSVQ